MGQEELRYDFDLLPSKIRRLVPPRLQHDVISASLIFQAQYHTPDDFCPSLGTGFFFVETMPALPAQAYLSPCRFSPAGHAELTEVSSLGRAALA